MEFALFFMEVRFDVVTQNMHVIDDILYFSMGSSDVIPVSRSIDDIVSKHIGALKVRKSDLETVKFREERLPTEDTAPLRNYLDVLEKKFEVGEFYSGVTTDAADAFGLGYTICATTGNIDDLRLRSRIRDCLAHLENFDRYEKEKLIVIDKQKTEEKLKALERQLDPQVLDSYVSFSVVPNNIHFIGAVSLSQVKGEGRTKIERTKTDLIERLKNVRGPTLSFDAFSLLSQRVALYHDAALLLQKYGDILKNPMWERRLFKLDP